MLQLKLNSEREVTEMRKKFLKLTKDGSQDLDIDRFKGKFVIYGIINIATGKLYIGKTCHLLNRANNYTYNYRRHMLTGSKEVNLSGHRETRRIIKAICEEGIDNFIMFPIDLAEDRRELAQKEAQYICLYNTLDPKIGYNMEIPSGSDFSSKAGMKGKPHTIATKIKKSKIVACVEPDKKILIISIGMKLFGDLVNSGKDQVKNCTRRGIRHHGFYIVYLNNLDRTEIRDNIRRKRKYFNSMKAINKGSGFSYNYYDSYLEIVDMVESLIADRSEEIFLENGYECYFLNYNQSNNDNSNSYVIEDISNFFDIVEY